MGRTWQEEEADGSAELRIRLGGLVGLATASMAITLAVREPPPGVHKNAYLLAITGPFFAGVAEVMAAVWVSNNPRAAGRKLMYASVGPLAVVVGLSAASLMLW
ncbi:uncharacterized protein LOC133909800 [Phragmites australis]|uniref:uncharacterized protein LOC133909800 n=1 Tax=Phragmites australis TaxID=29695 RepID=UPI002D78CED8|nr:uncharacterized protein LOC133909800 [Phragmites australis]